MIPKFYVIRDKDEKIGIRFQSKEDSTFFNQTIKDILAKQVFQDENISVLSCFESGPHPIYPAQNISPDSSDNEESEDEIPVSVSPDGNNHCCYSKGKLPPAPLIPVLDLSKIERGNLSRGKAQKSIEDLPRSNQGDIEKRLKEFIGNMRPSKRPDSEMSISTVRDFDWK